MKEKGVGVDGLLFFYSLFFPFIGMDRVALGQLDSFSLFLASSSLLGSINHSTFDPQSFTIPILCLIYLESHYLPFPRSPASFFVVFCTSYGEIIETFKAQDGLLSN